MNRKANTICFILLFLFLISAVSATDCENETTETISSNVNETNDDQTLQACDVEKNNSEENTISTTNKQNVTLKVHNVTVYYNDGHKLKATLIDKNKKPISNVTLKISVDGKTYPSLTNKNGIAQINLNLKSDTYNVKTVFDGTDMYEKASANSTVTIKSTIKCRDYTTHYKNTAAYSATFYDARGNALKNAQIKFQINSKTYFSKTNNMGVAKLSINLKPGKYSITLINPQTLQKIRKSITIKSLIETKNLVMNEFDESSFNVKILDSHGRPAPCKIVALVLNGKIYIKTTNKNGETKLPIDLESGKYTITTKYGNLTVNNKITVNNMNKTSSFKHIISIPNYVNITLPYVYPNAKYTLKTGVNGTVKMPKIEIFTVQIETKTYQFATGNTYSGIVTMQEKSYLVPFNGGDIVCSKNKNLLIDNGIMITRYANTTEIEYRSNTNDSVELFGFYADKGIENSEILTYMQNDKITAKVSIQTQYFDEAGVKYSLAKFYNRTNTNFAYYEIINTTSNPVIFTNTGKPVTYNYYERSIVGYCSKVDIITKFIVTGKEELEKMETISYGLGENYRRNYGFEVLQAYTIITEKINQKTVEDWISMNSNYLNRFGVMNVYGMHLASLETTWLADEIADNYATEFGVTWKRCHAITILGGINLEDTYLNVLNSDMGMAVKGNPKNAILFRLLNSMNLPNIEDYVLTPVSERYMDNATNSLDNVLSSINKNEFSMVQFGDLLYVFSKDDSAIILNCTNGVASVILHKNNSTYKGSSISTSRDCCGVGIIPQDIIAGIRTTIRIFAPAVYEFTDELNKIHPFSVIAYMGIKFLLEHTLTGASAASMGLISTMTLIQTGGTMYRNNMVDENEWYKTMNSITFTRPGYLQGKKIYNIPNNKGGYDYIEVKINDDLSLDRNNAIYISDGKTKKLTKKETYQYFCEDYWTPFSMPTKYWDESWRIK